MTNKAMKQTLLCMLCALITACSTDDYGYSSMGSVMGGSSSMMGGGTMGGSSSVDGTSELFTFDVAVDETVYSESETVDADDDDFQENTNFKKTVTVTFSENNVTYTDLPDDCEATVDGAKLTITASTSTNIIYKLSGSSSDGMFKIYSDKKFAVELAGLTLCNTDGPAINIQTKKRVFIIVDSGTTNTLSDGTEYADTGDENAKGVIFSEGQLIFSGDGKLNINANCKAGISSDQYLRFRKGLVVNVVASEGNAIRGKDSLIVSGGALNMTVSGNGNKGLKSDGPIYINGGRTIVVNSAIAYYDTDEADTKGPAGINTDGDFTMNGGEVWIKSTGKGGKGISVDGTATFNGGKVRVITTGQKYTYSNKSSLNKSPKGIRSEGVMTINGGDIMSRATGGEGSEAIESKSYFYMIGGEVQAYGYDDAINSASHMYLQGGSLLGVSSSNDGIDTNGNMYISGGQHVGIGLGEDGVDVIERGTLAITGGTLLSLGNTYMTSPSSSSTQGYLTQSVSGLSLGSTLTLKSGSTSLFTYTMPVTMSRAYMILSTSGMTSGGSYTVSVN